MTTKTAIAYCSPAGSTRHVARVIEAVLAETAAEVAVLDLKEAGSAAGFAEAVRAMAPEDLLFVGSPVYRDMAVPPVLRFIEGLPRVDGVFAVPFVTWGGAFSGIALWQMGRALALCWAQV